MEQPKITRTVAIDDLTPAEMASIFAHWFDEEQAEFFNVIARESKDWPGSGFCMQACHIAEHLDDGGRRIIGDLAGHALPESPSS